jgi:hypothetical protein
MWSLRIAPFGGTVWEIDGRTSWRTGRGRELQRTAPCCLAEEPRRAAVSATWRQGVVGERCCVALCGFKAARRCPRAVRRVDGSYAQLRAIFKRPRTGSGQRLTSESSRAAMVGWASFWIRIERVVKKAALANGEGFGGPWRKSQPCCYTSLHLVMSPIYKVRPRKVFPKLLEWDQWGDLWRLEKSFIFLI